jgi:hypothetical protein
MAEDSEISSYWTEFHGSSDYVCSANARNWPGIPLCPNVYQSAKTRVHITVLREHATVILQVLRQSFPLFVFTYWSIGDREVSADWLSNGRGTIIARCSNDSGLGTRVLSPISSQSLNPHMNIVLPYPPLRAEEHRDESDTWRSDHQVIPWRASFSSHTEAKIRYGAVIGYCGACGVALAWHGLGRAPFLD